MLVVSADSRQVYLHMNIGTGMPNTSELEMLPHYGVDCLAPTIKYSVYQYLIYAAEGLAAARRDGREAWVCGGTGLYIRAMVDQLELGTYPRPRLRAAVAQAIRNSSARQVARELQLDLADPDNPVRVIRGAELACAGSARETEIYTWAGLSPADDVDNADNQVDNSEVREELNRWQCAGIAVLDPGYKPLLGLIKRRVQAMFDQGLVDEVAALRRLGYGQADVVVNGIGYREAGQVIDGELSVGKAIELTVIRTRQYAKRQRTYFRGQGWQLMRLDELDAWEEATRPRD
ncbi:hypothetical protein JW859_11025 [bacterium]|nr:hypothetical protein [bacterium]